MIPKLTPIIAETFPHDPAISKGAYNGALRAKVLDCLRGLLPAATMTNMGLFGNGRFYETLLQRLRASNLFELTNIASAGFVELNKVSPSFVRRSEEDHKHNIAYNTFMTDMGEDFADVARAFNGAFVSTSSEPTVKLIHSSKDAPIHVAAALLFPYCNSPLESIKE